MYKRSCDNHNGTTTIPNEKLVLCNIFCESYSPYIYNLSKSFCERIPTRSFYTRWKYFHSNLTMWNSANDYSWKVYFGDGAIEKCLNWKRSVSPHSAITFCNGLVVFAMGNNQKPLHQVIVFAECGKTTFQI